MAEIQEELEPSGSGNNTTPGIAGRILAFLTCGICRRRARPVKGENSTKNYEEIRKLAKELTPEEKAACERMAWWSEAETKAGARVFVVAPRGPHGNTECYIDMWALFGYTLDQMHDHVIERGGKYAVVWCQFSNHRVWPLSAHFFRKLLPLKYDRGLEVLHVVHPSWTVRLLRLALWPFASDEFWDQFESHERIEFLDSHLSLKKLALPSDIIEYDQWLDKQAAEASKNAAKQMNGGFGTMFGGGPQNDFETKQHREQMEELRKVMEEKGYDKKSM
jgi:hypothetical protein